MRGQFRWHKGIEWVQCSIVCPVSYAELLFTKLLPLILPSFSLFYLTPQFLFFHLFNSLPEYIFPRHFFRTSTFYSGYSLFDYLITQHNITNLQSVLY